MYVLEAGLIQRSSQSHNIIAAPGSLIPDAHPVEREIMSLLSPEQVLDVVVGTALGQSLAVADPLRHTPTQGHSGADTANLSETFLRNQPQGSKHSVLQIAWFADSGI